MTFRLLENSLFGQREKEHFKASETNELMGREKEFQVKFKKLSSQSFYARCPMFECTSF